ncbi:MAG TPA: flavin reductase family protein [Alphaproteobacteria bacterium]|nr:flavin reductase family protein [Alphaproteobacteria bacterium]
MIDPWAFRRALGSFATGICVMTARNAAGAPVGVTINSFASVSLDPPLVLFSLDRTAGSLPDFRAFGHYAVNVLAAGQRELSMRFALPRPHPWDGVAWESWESGAPILAGCLANLDCRIEAVHEGGDHVILVGRVLRLGAAEAPGAALLYYRGGYAELPAEG